ncbi:hypothetical protein AB0B51_30645 [Streptomyces griseus]|nr:hypothetical protein [Streptomyces griseus]
MDTDFPNPTGLLMGEDDRTELQRPRSGTIMPVVRPPIPTGC